jgi:hypothetical protein
VGVRGEHDGLRDRRFRTRTGRKTRFDGAWVGGFESIDGGDGTMDGGSVETLSLGWRGAWDSGVARWLCSTWGVNA